MQRNSDRSSLNGRQRPHGVGGFSISFSDGKSTMKGKEKNAGNSFANGRQTSKTLKVDGVGS
jgi:hypothetical protein